MKRAGATLALAFVAACASPHRPVHIGSKAFTESVILGDALVFTVDHEGGKAVHDRELGGSQVLWNALLRGDIDAYVEYTGTLVGETLSSQALDKPEDLAKYLATKGVRMSRSLGFNNTYALGMTRARAAELGVAKISDLASRPSLVFGFANEFMEREDGWKGLTREYGLKQTDVRGMAHTLAYKAMVTKAIDVTDLYTTDGEIERYDLVALEDDKNFFPRYDAVVLYRTSTATATPALEKAVHRLEGSIDEHAMTKLNARVKHGGEHEAEVAAGFLAKKFGIAAKVEDTSMVSRIAERTREHLGLVFLSLFAAIILAIPLGVIAARHRVVGQGVLAVVGVLQTVPSLALLVFMIPFLGVGTAPAVAALFLYSLLPIVRNTHAGLVSIPRDLVESAEVLGLSSWARLRLVELPIAIPAILAGIQTSAVINVGTATLGAFIGAGGYGQPILTGIRRDDLPTILEGAIPAAVLALVAQGVFEMVERLVVPRGLRIPKGE